MLIRSIVLSCGLFAIELSVAQAAITAEPISIDEAHPGTTTSVKVVVRNDSDDAATIDRQDSASTRLKATNLPLVVASHGSADIEFTVAIDGDVGIQRYEAKLVVSGQDKPLYIRIPVFVHSFLTADPPEVNLGVVRAGSSASASAKLSSAEAPSLRVTNATDSQGQILAEVANDGAMVMVRTRADATWGMHTGRLELKTNSSLQPLVSVPYRFELRGSVVPETYQLDSGLLRRGQLTAQTLFLRDTENKPLRLGKVWLDRVRAALKIEDCPVKEASCKAIQVRLADDVASGWFADTIHVELPQYKQTLAIGYRGLLVEADTEITEVSNKKTEAAPADLVTAIKSATTPTPAPIVMPTPPGSGPLLKWRVENERQVYGYIIYRADSEGGPTRRVNEKLIKPLSSEEGVPVDYKWRDTTAEPGRTYWYKIGTIDQRDDRKDLTGWAKKTYAADPGAAK